MAVGSSQETSAEQQREIAKKALKRCPALLADAFPLGNPSG